jgi:ankyrin repeat protein
MLLDFGESLYGYGGEDNFLQNTIAIGNYCMAKVLLEHGATEYMEKRDWQFGGSTALQTALELGQRYIFMELLKHGASVQTQLVPAKLHIPGAQISSNKERSSYLHFCAETGSDVFFVREFIRRGLPVNQPDCEWRTPLYLALKAGHLEIAKLAGNLVSVGQLADRGISYNFTAAGPHLSRDGEGAGVCQAGRRELYSRVYPGGLYGQDRHNQDEHGQQR